ncbi:MAG: FliG C-terminal domain-containing protein [Pseudomonadota bacterium]
MSPPEPSPTRAAAEAAAAAAASPPLATGTAKGGKSARQLTQSQKAAVVIVALGPEISGPILETLDEGALRNFTGAMARLGLIDADTVRLVIAEFLDAIHTHDSLVRGGLAAAREMLEPHIAEGLLTRILDDVDSPSASNVWKKLGKVNDDALAEYLSREHPQTAAVILSKLSSEHAGRVLNRFDPDRAREVVQGITRAQSLDVNVIEAIGASVSRDFLATNAHTAPRRDPAERVGAIMNYTSAETRDHILGYLEQHQPEFAEEVRRKMFTFNDIPKRMQPRDMAALVREVERETLLRALRYGQELGSEAFDFILSGISSRIAEQIRDEIRDIDKPRRKDGEAAQAAVVASVRALEARGELRLAAPDDDA